MITQRKVALYGIRARETPEDVQEREIRKEMRSLFPELFGGESTYNADEAQTHGTIGEPLPMPVATRDLRANTTTMLGATRYVQIRVLHEWLVPVLKKSIMR